MIDDFSPEDWENRGIIAKPVVWTILNRIHCERMDVFEYSLNVKIDYNYRNIHHNDIPSENLISVSLSRIGAKINDISITTIQAQFKDKRIPEMNLYSRPEIIHQIDPTSHQHVFNKIKFIKRPSAPRNESKLYHVVLAQENRNSPQLYGSIQFDHYTVGYVDAMRDSMNGNNMHHQEVPEEKKETSDDPPSNSQQPLTQSEHQVQNSHSSPSLVL